MKSNALDLGEDLTDEIAEAIRCAQKSPLQFRILRRRDGMRRVLTKRFPYKVFFTVEETALYVGGASVGHRPPILLSRRFCLPVEEKCARKPPDRSRLKFW